MIRLLYFFAICLLLGSCATLSEDECRLGDWRGIGYADGAAGRSAGYIENHRKACAEVGVTPDLTLWLAGREQGLRQYCTPQNAYRVGRNGRSINDVCTASERRAMSTAYRHGMQYHEFGEDIRDLQHEVAGIEADMAALEKDGLTPEERRLHATLVRVRIRLRLEISRLETRRLLYSHWP